ncbi:hypothetical protein BN982_02674 [Halobacillus karajensis]|uniref:DUF3953 domain-containing protein n=1 Tax=Halobacillus karajensis TaxID=195088 RepID=A0A059NZG0_9BACI|nr:hypothetical protein BN982_02674 [Halobacillus karajensis]CDQ23592.1 hypothetical protein BN983_01834 [Halobacillus karajensis]CDQ27074.1 hypothetical protein BN981_01321 [Halobacillus karajensis]
MYNFSKYFLGFVVWGLCIYGVITRDYSALPLMMIIIGFSNLMFAIRDRDVKSKFWLGIVLMFISFGVSIWAFVI